MCRPINLFLITLVLLALVVPAMSYANEAAQKTNSVAEAEVLRAQAEAAGDDADLFARAATAYGDAKMPKEALRLQQRAVELRPDDPWLLASQGAFASWEKNYVLAESSYQRSLALNPVNAQTWVDLARLQSWRGELDDSAYSYRRALALEPARSEALLEAARINSQRGDYGRAREQINAYRDIAGDDAAYRQVKAQILAWGDRPDAALELTQRAIELDPNDATSLCTEAVALNQAREFRRSLARLNDCAAHSGSGTQADDLREILETSLGPASIRGIRHRSPYRPSYDWEPLYLTRPVGKADVQYRGDTDEVDAAVEGSLAFHYPLNPDLIVGATTGYEHLWADVGSGFDTKDGKRDTGYAYAAAELETRLADRLWLGTQLGADVTLDGDVSPRYRLALDYRIADAWQVAFVQEHRLLSYSPRTVSLGTEVNSTQLLAQWTPDLRWTVEAGAGYHHFFSHGNNAWNAFVAPRRAVVRRQHLSIDVGVRALWWGFEDQNTGRGYYDPELFQRYVATMNLRTTPHEKVVFNVYAAAGIAKDETTHGVEPVGDLYVEGIFGFFGDWKLKARTGVTSSVHSGGNYVGWNGGLRFIRRF